MITKNKKTSFKFPKLGKFKIEDNTPSSKPVFNTQNLKQPSQNPNKNKFKKYVKDYEIRIHPGDNNTGCFFVTNNYKDPNMYKPMFNTCLEKKNESLKPTVNKYIKLVKVQNYKKGKRQEELIPQYYRDDPSSDE